jgi:hypothetical protein
MNSDNKIDNANQGSDIEICGDSLIICLCYIGGDFFLGPRYIRDNIFLGLIVL